MFKLLKLGIGVAATATLVACGGSGDSGPTTTIPVEKTFPLQAIYLSYLNTSHSYTINSNAVVNGITATSLDSRTLSAQKSATFESAPATVVEEIRITGSYIPGGPSTTSLISNYYNSTGQRIGYTQRDSGAIAIGNYGVLQGSASSLPLSAKVGDSGNLSSLAYYSDTNKKTLIANSSSVWALKSGFGAAAALLEVKETITGVGATSAITIVYTDQYSIDANNSMALSKNQTETKNGLVVVSTSTDIFTGK